MDKRIYLCLAHMSGKEQDFIREAFDTNWVVPLGPNVNGFEQDLETFVGENKHVVALSAGTAAVHLSLLACGVGVGDEVMVQSFTFCASSHPVTYLGATPVFVDSEEDTWNMDPQLLDMAIADRIAKTGKKPKAIVPVYLYGMPAKLDEIMAVADKYDIPVVVIGKVEGQYAHVYSVDTDNFGDSIALTDALIESGHQNIACLHAPLDVHVSVDRVNGYKQSLAAHNIAVRDEWIVDGGYTHETALQAARELLSQSPLPEAVFATDSLKLMSIYRAAAEKNIAIPQQLAVVGYSNETLSFILTPAPGGIDVPTQELGQQSCELLFRLISGKPSPQNITVATHMTLK